MTVWNANKDAPATVDWKASCSVLEEKYELLAVLFNSKVEEAKRYREALENVLDNCDCAVGRSVAKEALRED